MRIDQSINIYQISLQTQQEQLLPQSVAPRQTVAAVVSNARSSQSASIIDAEYVEIYTSKNAIPYKPSSNSSDFSTDTVKQNSRKQQQRIAKHNMVSRYQAMAADTPITGKYLNIFV